MNAESLVSAAMVQRLYGIPASRVRYWAYAGRLPRVESGYYRLGDVLALQAALTKRAAKGDQRVRSVAITPWPMQQRLSTSQLRHTKRRTTVAATLDYNG